MELSNPHGVAKVSCAPMSLDPQGAVRMRLVLPVDAGRITNWSTGEVVASGPLHKGDAVMITVAPGDTTYIELRPA